MTVNDGDFIKVDYTESVDGRVIATTNKDLAIEKDLYDEGAEYGPRIVVVGTQLSCGSTGVRTGGAGPSLVVVKLAQADHSPQSPPHSWRVRTRQ